MCKSDKDISPYLQRPLRSREEVMGRRGEKDDRPKAANSSGKSPDGTPGCEDRECENGNCDHGGKGEARR